MVELRLSSKRFNCYLRLKEKVTFVVGNSGGGKTEMVRRLNSSSSSKSIKISNGFSYEVLTGKRFSDSCNNALRHILHDNGMSSEDFTTLEEKIKKKYYCDYWRNELNFPFNNSILIIDDEDFVDTLEFQAFFDCDCSNYYLIINRLHLDKIGYSVYEVYNYKAEGINHFLEKRYDLLSNRRLSQVISADYLRQKYLSQSAVNETKVFYFGWHRRLSRPYFSSAMAGLK